MDWAGEWRWRLLVVVGCWLFCFAPGNVAIGPRSTPTGQKIRCDSGRESQSPLSNDHSNNNLRMLEAISPVGLRFHKGLGVQTLATEIEILQK